MEIIQTKKAPSADHPCSVHPCWTETACRSSSYKHKRRNVLKQCWILMYWICRDLATLSALCWSPSRDDSLIPAMSGKVWNWQKTFLISTIRWFNDDPTKTHFQRDLGNELQQFFWFNRDSTTRVHKWKLFKLRTLHVRPLPEQWMTRTTYRWL